MPVLTLALLAMTSAQLLDLGTFVTMVRRLGPGAELNPLAIGMIEVYGFPMAAIAKVALIALVAAIAVLLTGRGRRIDRVVGAAVVTAAIVAGIIGGWSNAMTMGPL